MTDKEKRMNRILLSICIAVPILIGCFILMSDEDENEAYHYEEYYEETYYEPQYTSWQDCVAVEFQTGSMTIHLVVKNICQDTLEKVEIEYYVGGYDQEDIRTATFYNIEPNSTQSQLLGVRDPNIILALYRVKVKL